MQWKKRWGFYSNYIKVQVSVLAVSNKVEIIKIAEENTKFYIPIKFACE